MIKEVSPGKLAAAKGFANESRLLAALLERGFNASRVDLPHSTYDMVLVTDGGSLIRIQVKTVSSNGRINFSGGTRGGIDRKYRSDIKTYTQNTETADVVVGVRSVKANGDTEIDFFFVPTIFIEKIGQKSILISKVQESKNNWILLEKCKDKDFVYSELTL